MSQYFYVHPDNPQARLIKQAVAMIREGGGYRLPDGLGLRTWLSHW